MNETLRQRQDVADEAIEGHVEHAALLSAQCDVERFQTPLAKVVELPA